MKSLLLVFFITLASLCVSLYLWQIERQARKERDGWAGRVQEREAGIARFDSSEEGKRWWRNDDSSGNQRRQRTEENNYLEAMKAARDDAAQREDDARQVALSSGGVALIGILGLAFRGRQLWNQGAPRAEHDDA